MGMGGYGYGRPMGMGMPLGMGMLGGLGTGMLLGEISVLDGSRRMSLLTL